MSIGSSCRSNVQNAEKMLRSSLDTSREWKQVANQLRQGADQARKIAKLAEKMERLGGKTAAYVKMRRGVYQTQYGTQAYVSGPRAKTAYDVEMQKQVPIAIVTQTWIRDANSRLAALGGVLNQRVA